MYILCALTCLNAQLAHVNVEGTLVETSRLSPVKQDRANLLFEKPEHVTHWSVALTLMLIPRFPHLSSPSSSSSTKSTLATWSLSSRCDTQEEIFLNSSMSTPIPSTSRKKRARSSSAPPANT